MSETVVGAKQGSASGFWKWIVGIFTTLLISAASFYLLSLRKTRLEATVWPPMHNGLALKGNHQGPLTAKEIAQEKHPIYKVTVINVSQQTLFACHVDIDAFASNDQMDKVISESGSTAFDINANDHHEWDDIDGPGGPDHEVPIELFAVCTYYDAFGFKHLLRRRIAEDSGFRGME